VYRTINVVNVRREYVSHPLIFTLLVRDVKLFNGVTVDGGLVSIDDRVVAVDPDGLLVMRTENERIFCWRSGNSPYWSNRARARVCFSSFLAGGLFLPFFR
jgi:hypothetical protein